VEVVGDIFRLSFLFGPLRKIMKFGSLSFDQEFQMNFCKTFSSR
jgi:hypothetical protein